MRVQSISSRRPQGGFTLIELVMVIVIVGVLSAVAIPKFIDLSGDAKKAAVEGMAGALASGAAINYAGRKANAANGVAIANCGDTAATLQTVMPNNFVITGTAPDCVLTANGETANFKTILIN
ncbi:MAG: type II secretion system protein [Burkholderiales bacterium]|nr:type II secretion system protein [Burkholderiales bacterium]MBP6676986.1 type II secretion system protein [Vitreoscilla sp.]